MSADCWQLSKAAMKVEELSGTRREAWNCVRVQCDAHLTIAGVQLCAKNRTTLPMSTVGRQHVMHETESRWPIFVNRFSSRKATHFSRNGLFSTVRNEVLPPLLTTSISEPSAPRHARASRGGRWRTTRRAPEKRRTLNKPTSCIPFSSCSAITPSAIH